MKPLAVDLFCGLGGWAEGFLAERYEMIGFDIERHDYGTGGYPAQLVLQDVLTLHGSQFRAAACIVASPPCQAYSYMAMPWKLAKAKAAAEKPPESAPKAGKGKRTNKESKTSADDRAKAKAERCFNLPVEVLGVAGKMDDKSNPDLTPVIASWAMAQHLDEDARWMQDGAS